LNLYGPNQKDVKKKKEDAHTIINLMIKQRGIDSLVYVNDAVYGSEKIEILLQNDVFVQTSRFEGLPLGILEALSLGLPCLVTKGTNLDELVNNYNAGWGVETNAKRIAEAIKMSFGEHSESLLTKSSASSKLIENEYTWTIIAKKEISNYKKMVNN
jgi:glycosyltransferase involved in cell wall biosynthesis